MSALKKHEENNKLYKNINFLNHTIKNLNLLTKCTEIEICIKGEYIICCSSSGVASG